MERLNFTIGKGTDTNENTRGELTPNLLIMGGTASGKTTIISNIINELTSKNNPNELQMILVDTNTVSFSPFSNLPHLIQPVIKDAKTFPDILEYLVKEVDARYELLKNTKCNSAQKYNQKYPNKMPPIIVVIDEITDIMIANKGLEVQFVRFFQAYQRASDVHFIIGVTTSGDYTKWLSSLMLSCLGANKILLCPSNKDSYKVFPDLKDKLSFADLNERLGYYFSYGNLTKFLFDELKPFV